jgi:hypothetical protein
MRILKQNFFHVPLDRHPSIDVERGVTMMGLDATADEHHRAGENNQRESHGNSLFKTTKMLVYV